MAGHLLLAALVTALAVVDAPGVASAQPVQVLASVHAAPVDSVVDAGTLPPLPALGARPGTPIEPKPFLTPDPEGLRRWKESLQQGAPALGPADGAAGGAGPRLEEPGPLAPSVVTQFDGLANVDQGSTVFPPDDNLGVGPSHIFQMVNITGRITDKSGLAPSTFSLRGFFGVDPGFGESDPRVLYDAISGRWFGVYLQYSQVSSSSALILAVSTSSDPTGLFCRYRLGNPASENFLQDFPMLGMSDDKVVVSYNGFTFPLSTTTFLGSGYYVVKKTDLLACGTAAVSRAAPSPARVSPQPAQSLGSTSNLYMPTHNFTGTLTLLTIAGIPGVTPVTEASTPLAIRSWSAPPNAFQPGFSIQLDTGDSRVLSAAWQSQSLWLAGGEACLPPGDSGFRACLRVIEVRTDTMTVRQDMTRDGGAGNYYFYPAVRPDASGNLHVVFTHSSTVAFPSVRATGRLAGDPLNTLQASILLRAGGGAQTDIDPNLGVGRMGDYAGAAVDPSDPQTVWVIGEYIRATGGRNWGTWVAQLRFVPPVPPIFLGGVYVAAGNVDGVAGAEIITGPGAGTALPVKVFKPDGTPLGAGFFPYTAAFTGGVRVAACDFTSPPDGRVELVTGAGPGGGPHVRVIQVDAAGTPVGDLASFFAYSPAFTGGVFVACGDVNGDGVPDIITGADAGGGPHVRVFSGANPAVELAGFFAYSPAFTGGVRVAACDVNGDGQADIVTGAGPGGGPHVRVFSGANPAVELAGFFAYSPLFTGGVHVACGNLLGSGAPEIVTGADAGGGPHVRAFTGGGADAGPSFFAYSPLFTGGVRVAAGNLDGAGFDEIITGAGAGGGPHVRAFLPDGTPTSTSFFAY